MVIASGSSGFVSFFGSGTTQVILAAVIGLAGSLIAAVIATRSSGRAEAQERKRLSSEVFGPYGNPPDSPPAHEGPYPVAPKKAALPALQVQSERDGISEGRPPADGRDSVYDQLLINDYALGLTQARRAFNVSMSFSILGGVVLVLGVSLAIFRIDTGGQVAGAAITSAAGVLTSSLSQLFRGQSAKALKHLEVQATELRKDVRAQTNADTAQGLLGEVTDPALRSRLQAALILQFSGATLPELGTAQAVSLNGKMHSAELTETLD